MSQKTLLGFSIIGIPDGFEISSNNLNKQISSSSLEGKVALDSSLINIFPETDILMVWREVDKDFYRHYFVYYRYATEIDRTRTGTYYGSVVTIQDRIARPANYLMLALTDLADVVKQQCLTEDSRFNRNIKDLQFNLPESGIELKDNLERAELFEGQYNRRGFFPIGDNQDITNYSSFIEQVFNNSVLSDFQILYASKHKEVLNRVKEKNILEILSLSKLEENKRLFQQQQEQERIIKEEEQKEREAALQKALQEKEAAFLRPTGKMPAQKELPAKFMNLESRVDDLERRFKVLSDQLREETSKSNLFNNLLERVRIIGWAKVVIAISTLIIIIFLSNWYFSSPSKEPESSTINNTNSKPITTQTAPIKSTTETLSPMKTPMQIYPDKIQLIYQGNSEEIKNVGDLIKLIKSKCNASCSVTDEAIAESILSINEKTFRNHSEINRTTVLDFELNKFVGKPTFEIVGCCDLSQTESGIFKSNSPKQ